MVEIKDAVVVHKAFGEGKIISTDGSHIEVVFNETGKKTFLFPNAFEKFLQFKDENLQNEMVAYFNEKKSKESTKQETMIKENKMPVTENMKYSKAKLIRDMNKGKQFSFHPFYGHKVTVPVSDFCFSNWYPCRFIVDEIQYHTTEQYMMAQKALLFKDIKIYEEIMRTDNPKDYKALGRQVKNFSPGVWNKHKYEIVLKGCKAKFSQNPDFATVLLNTEEEVIMEAAPRDVIWGVGLGKNNEKINNPKEWRGTNYLGFILMEVRDYLKE